ILDGLAENAAIREKKEQYGLLFKLFPSNDDVKKLNPETSVFDVTIPVVLEDGKYKIALQKAYIPLNEMMNGENPQGLVKWFRDKLNRGAGTFDIIEEGDFYLTIDENAAGNLGGLEGFERRIKDFHEAAVLGVAKEVFLKQDKDNEWGLFKDVKFDDKGRLN